VHGELRVRLGGIPIAGGAGLSMTGSQVDLAAAGTSAVFQGRIVSLQGSEFVARVTDPAGTVLNLHAQLQINNSSNTVTGSLTGSSAGGGA
jgi:hypothetical protein